MSRFSRCALVALVLIACVGCDQVSKSAARAYLPGSGIHSYLSDTFRLEYAQNPGAFLSLGESLAPAVRYGSFIVGVGVFVVGLLLWAMAAPRLTWLQRAALAAMGAGGAVTDFLNLGLGSLRTGIFNLADASLMLGAVVLLISSRSVHDSAPVRNDVT